MDEPSGIIRLRLTPEQERGLAPILDACRAEQRYEGVLCTLARAYCPQAGDSVLELQIAKVQRARARKLLASALGAVSRAKTSPPV
jgi:hypothetical protein